MKLSTHRTTTVPRKGPTIVQCYKKKLASIAKAKEDIEELHRRDQTTRDHLGITMACYRNWREFTRGCVPARVDFEDFKARRLAQALQGPKLPALPFAKPTPERDRKWYKELLYFICR